MKKEHRKHKRNINQKNSFSSSQKKHCYRCLSWSHYSIKGWVCQGVFWYFSKLFLNYPSGWITIMATLCEGYRFALRGEGRHNILLPLSTTHDSLNHLKHNLYILLSIVVFHVCHYSIFIVICQGESWIILIFFESFFAACFVLFFPLFDAPIISYLSAKVNSNLEKNQKKSKIVVSAYCVKSYVEPGRGCRRGFI